MSRVERADAASFARSTKAHLSTKLSRWRDTPKRNRNHSVALYWRVSATVRPVSLAWCWSWTSSWKYSAESRQKTPCGMRLATTTISTDSTREYPSSGTPRAPLVRTLLGSAIAPASTGDAHGQGSLKPEGRWQVLEIGKGGQSVRFVTNYSFLATI